MMRPDSKVEKVYLYPKPVDFRKSIDGLTALVELDIKVAAKVNGQEPYTWLRHVLERLPHASSVADYEALLPWNCSQEMPR
ncbi:hypothetical protein BGP83_13605 [Pseudomonas putida]|nr:hypothetical protein BGP83_13605 [Pseudomonas putida]